MGESENLDERQMATIGIMIAFVALFLVLVNILDNKSINGIKAKQVGDGQHGTARWATKQEIRRSFSSMRICSDTLRTIQHSSTASIRTTGWKLYTRIS